MRDSELYDALTDIRGVGDRTANKIMRVIEEHTDDTDGSPYLNKAKQAAEAGNDREAAVYLRRANE